MLDKLPPDLGCPMSNLLIGRISLRTEFRSTVDLAGYTFRLQGTECVARRGRASLPTIWHEQRDYPYSLRRCRALQRVLVDFIRSAENLGIQALGPRCKGSTGAAFHLRHRNSLKSTGESPGWHGNMQIDCPSSQQCCINADEIESGGISSVFRTMHHRSVQRKQGFQITSGTQSPRRENPGSPLQQIPKSNRRHESSRSGCQYPRTFLAARLPPQRKATEFTKSQNISREGSQRSVCLCSHCRGTKYHAARSWKGSSRMVCQCSLLRGNSNCET